jgi:polygalacturonase
MKNKIVFLCLSAFFAIQLQAQAVYSVRDFGAKGNGKTVDTKAIQAAIDKAASTGGGVVLFPPGQYVSGSIILKDYITLRFENGSILLGSTHIKDYPADLGVIYLADPYVWRGPLIYAENVRYIGLEGIGIIDGRGTRENFPPFPREEPRPGLIRFTNCQFVTVRDVTMRNPACWTFHLRNCEDVNIRDIRLNSYSNRNNDGIDVDGCRRVSITGCNIRSEDDAIVLKSFQRDKSCDIVISDCILNSTCSAIKIGTETMGDFENISISNCSIYGSRGINLFSVDGADINGVTISNITMRDTKSAIQLRLGARLRPYQIPKDQQITSAGRIRNVQISHVQAVIAQSHASTGVDNSQNFICGIPGHRIENLSLSDIFIELYGNGTTQQSQRAIPEEEKAYPKIGMFGDLPAYGFYVRHVENLRMNNIRFHLLNPDLRPAIVLDDVQEASLQELYLGDSRSQEQLIQQTGTSAINIR